MAAQDFQSRASLVILSDLNNPSCGLRLVKIFKTYEKTQKCPALFIFMGPFHEKLSEQIAVALEGSQRVISEARFVFVPAARDFMSPEVYPIILKSPLLGADDKSMSIRQRSDPLLRFLSPLRTLNVECEFASNPCRIFFFTKEIVVINDEVTKCFKSNDIFHRESQTSASAMETMLHQASIFPFSLQAKARRWDLEHATCLYPTPDYLILGEKSTSHQTIICGCLSVNPGSFSEDSSFAVLFPLIDRVDLW